ncbi:MAG: TlpA disulfide reductase family protein [Candidatus Planktophila sp.]|nr:TlpA disulfide reductase family protein [Candidatus Planktophila sp.]
MKKIAAALSLLLVTSCAAPTTDIAGVLVSCTTLQTQNVAKPIEIGCLDGSVGASVNALRGPAIINVWGSWCGPCKEEMPILRSFYAKGKGKLQLVGVDVEEASIKDGQEFVLKNGVTWPNLFDRDGSTRAYFGMGVPVTWFIAADGSVAYKRIGVLKNEIELIKLTSKYLGVKL